LFNVRWSQYDLDEAIASTQAGIRNNKIDRRQEAERLFANYKKN
jgi:predicted exporter